MSKTSEVTCGILGGVKPPEWDTRAGRILYLFGILEREHPDKSQRERSAMVFGEASKSRIATLKTRFKQGSTGDELPVDTFDALETFFKVPKEWLEFNRGWPWEHVRKRMEGGPPERRSSSQTKLARPDSRK